VRAFVIHGYEAVAQVENRYRALTEMEASSLPQRDILASERAHPSFYVTHESGLSIGSI
jgi:hypothetical protein